jgi:hypothetical protein
MSVKNKQRRIKPPTQPAPVPLVVLRTPSNITDLSEKHKQRTIASNAFDRLVEQVKATPLDWMNVHARIMVGSLAMGEYFDRDSEVSNMFNQALIALTMCWTRHDVTDEWGLTFAEQDSIREAFHIVDALVDNLKLSELKILFGKAVQTYDMITSMNKLPMSDAGSRDAMLQELADEYKQTKQKGVA